MKRSSSAITPGGAKKSFKKRKTLRKKGTPEMYSKGQVFPDVLTTKLRYNSTMARINPAAASYYCSFVLNGMHDFDFDNVLGNKQPLYFDELITSDGPYKSYNVQSWNSLIHIENQSTEPLMVYWSQSTSVGESDTLIEVQNRPNVKELLLTAKGGSKDVGVIKAPGSMKEIWGPIRVNNENAVGSNAANPTAASWGTLFFYNPGGIVATPVNCFIKITHDFNAVLSTADAIIS